MQPGSPFTDPAGWQIKDQEFLGHYGSMAQQPALSLDCLWAATDTQVTGGWPN